MDFAASRVTGSPLSAIRNLVTVTAVAALAGCTEGVAPPVRDPSVATTVAFISGAGQSGLGGTVVPVAPVAQVKDQYGDPMPGVPVTFSINGGFGTVSDIPVITNAEGNATSPTWTLGKFAHNQVLAAAISGASTTVSASIITQFNAEVRFHGPPMHPFAEAAFVDAAARIRAAITGDIPDIPLPPGGLDLAQCGAAGVVLNDASVDDVIIYASVVAIDGPGNVLGSAGPCFIRTTGRLTIVGIMRFDTDDVQSLINTNQIRDVIQHEMLHVIGIGTLWGQLGLLADGGTPQTRFIGISGIAGCVQVGGSSICSEAVPVENTGGPGRADGHWRENVFGNELMSPSLNQGVNPLSLITIRSLADLGYVVNANAADSYTIPGTTPNFGFNLLADESRRTPLNVLRTPMFELSPTGRIRKVEAR